MKNSQPFVMTRESISMDSIEGEILCSTKSGEERNYVVKANYELPIFLTLKESDFIKGQGGKVILSSYFCIGKGRKGTIVETLPDKRYLCEFDAPFCNVILKEEEILPWDPSKKIFADLDPIRLAEDLPEHGFKKGKRGTIVHVSFHPSPVYLIEFELEEGEEQTFETYSLLPDQLILDEERIHS